MRSRRRSTCLPDGGNLMALERMLPVAWRRAGGVGLHPVVLARPHRRGQAHAALGGVEARAGDRRFDDLAQMNRAQLDLELAEDDARDVEHVVDEALLQ